MVWDERAPVMMWGYGPNMGWMWLWGVLLLVGIALLVLVAVRMFAGSGGQHVNSDAGGTRRRDGTTGGQCGRDWDSSAFLEVWRGRGSSRECSHCF